MQDNQLIILEVFDEFIGLDFGLSEDDCFMFRIVLFDEVDHLFVPFVSVDFQGEMLYGLGCLYA